MLAWGEHKAENVARAVTPFLGPVLENYLKTVEGPYSPDTLIQISDRLLDRTPPKSDQRKYVFSKIAQKFLSTDYLGKEVVYTHVAEKYMIKNGSLGLCYGGSQF
ncbi:hypothetical protein [Flectobacillus sp. BAB-3569]|uniref:hypothetical protein n=1 Tax=Flectobacillus sp. BAB-3569 TaxID=1509483 RepID=UPI000BA4AE56|nr:hypothetical protein [Flectobacillus sp. BAB-3569]PAC26212.1 hypothetical protein BWI92_26275 [Flectobacillus sp. BAB-3569]